MEPFVSTSTQHDQMRETNAEPVKKRNRPMLSCILCHERRVKCDRGRPCKSCISYGLPDRCAYAARPNKRSKAALGRSHKFQRYPDPNPTLAQYRAALYPTETKALGVPLLAFSTFVERFQDNTRAPSAGHDPQRSPYPAEVIQKLESARSVLPTVERTELLVTFFMEQLDWMFSIIDFDAMDAWLVPFLPHIKHGDLDHGRCKQGDATRLALVFACIVASVQIASEGLVKVFYPDPEPTSSILRVDSTRQSIKSLYENNLRNLLDVASQHDGPSPDLIRASLIYGFFLKNEGRAGEQGAAPLMQSISRLVRSLNLHLDPPISFSEEECESIRRLFWVYYIHDRITCITMGYPIAVSDSEITTQEPREEYTSVVMGKRLNTCLIYKARIFRRLEGFVEKMKNGVNEAAIIEYEQFLREWEQSLPAALHPSLPRLEPWQRTVRGFDLERHLLQAVYHISRSTLNRSCFFPTEGLSMEQVHRSRQACVDSALGMIRIQESLRMRIMSDHHLRCLFVPLFTLESAITLALASLIELASVSPSDGVPASVQEYMRWAYRGRDLLLTIPTDFTHGVQAVKLVSRVLSKATKIINLHALQMVEQTDDKIAIREILCDDDGKRLAIPLLDSHYKRSDRDNIHKSAFNNALQPTQSPMVTSNPSTLSSSASSFPTSSSNITTPVDGNNSFTATAFGEGSPTYADLGMDFFNELAAALQPANLFPISNSTTTTTSFPSSVPDPSNQSLDEQMDLWLASLQNIG